jgi:hypothetical protein
MKLVRPLIFISFALTPFFVFAQTNPDPAGPDVQGLVDSLIKNGFPTDNALRTNAISDLLEIKSSPANPGPNELVSVTIESYIVDLSKAAISWSVDGRLVSRGIGKTSFSFQNSSSGETKHITVTFVANTGEKATKDLLFSPVGVTVLWEANTYTPPFYKGKPLMSPQAFVRVIAIPDLVNTPNALSAQNLSYVWKKNGTTIPEVSGYGKSSYGFFGPRPGRDLNLRLGVSSLDDSVQSEMQVSVPMTNPFVLFYEKRPLLGVWNSRPLGTDLNLSQKEFTVVAEPYFFSNEHPGNPTLAYDWSLNGNSLAGLGRTITLRNEAGSKGVSELALSLRNSQQIFQAASQSLTVHFTADESSVHPTF